MATESVTSASEEPMVLGIITVRNASTRFPRRSLRQIGGRTVLEHVHQRSRMSNLLDALYVATPDDDVLAEGHRLGAQCVKVSQGHRMALNSVAEAVSLIEANLARRVGVVVEIWGDEPMLHPDTINSVIDTLHGGSGVRIASVMEHLEPNDYEDTDQVKVLVNKRSEAIAFARVLHLSRDRLSADTMPMYKFVGVSGYNRDVLGELASIPQADIEVAACHEMFRPIENGYPIKMVLSPYHSTRVYSEDSVQRVEHQIQEDTLISRYVPTSSA